jgi:putative ABC transport system ATP-binding protein
MNPMVRLDGVSKRYEMRAEIIQAVTDVSLTLRRGALTGFVGPSGSGKTTLINMIVGWERPSDGVVLRDAAVSNDWRGVAVVPQGLGLLGELSLSENVDLPVRLGNPRAVSTHDLMDSLGLGGLESRMPDEASWGEQQRTAIARALVIDSVVLVADEPTAHQDQARALEIGGLLRRTADAGSAVLVATHDHRILAGADDIVHIEHGRLVDAVS